MRHQLRNAVVLVTASTILGACAETPDHGPTGPNAALPLAPGATLTVPACDITGLKALARDYASSNRDALLTIIGDLGTAVKNGPTAAGTDKVFDGLARLAAMRGTSAQKSTATGAMFHALVTGLFGCAQSNVLTNTEDVDFSPALGTGWMFEVRGKNNTPAQAYDDPTDWAYARDGVAPATWWAAGPQAATWNASITSTTLAKRVLLYGYPDPTFLHINGTLGSGFELRSIPKIVPGTFGLALDIGLCFADASAISPTQRVNHDNTFLLNKPLTCGTGPTPISVSASASRLGPFNPVLLARRALDFFTPQPAYAFFVGAVGGGVSELSPSAVYDLSAITLGGLGTVADGQITTPLVTTLGGPLVVRATTSAGEPVEGVSIQMYIVGNSSSIAFFSVGGVPSVTVTRLTDANGYADFGGVYLTKAGGYQLGFRVSFDAISGPSLISNSFNYQNK